MRRGLLSAALTLVMLGLTAAGGIAGPPQPSRVAVVTFHTSPSGARVFQLGSGPDDRPVPGDAGFENALGLSGQPLYIDVDKTFRDSPRIYVRFKLDGHLPYDAIVDTEVLKSGRWPATGAQPLEPESLSVRLQDVFVVHRILIGTGLLGLTLAFLAFTRRDRRQRADVDRASRLEAYRASAYEDPWIGSKLGVYRLVARIGRGGMASVYRAVPDRTLDEGEAVAIKILTVAGDRESDEFRVRFRREVKVCHLLSHPNIVRLIDWGIEDPLFIVMELLRGNTLADRRMQRGGRVPLAECIALLRPLFAAVQYAHDQGVVHRDLKPENVMVTDEGVVKVMDFGIARSHNMSMQLTTDTTALGTPDYMAPEQIEGNPFEASDQYALGVIAYELLCGRRPHDAGELMAVLLARVTQEPIPLTRFAPERADVEPVLMKMLSTSALERYPSVTEAFEAFRRAASPPIAS